MAISLYGVDLNSMTSSALTSYSADLKRDIDKLSSTKPLTKLQKNELAEKQQAFLTISSQNKRLIKLNSLLHKNGIKLGNLKDYSLNTLVNRGTEEIDRMLAIEYAKGKDKQDGTKKSNLEDLRTKLTTQAGKTAFKRTTAANVIHDLASNASKGVFAYAIGSVAFEVATNSLNAIKGINTPEFITGYSVPEGQSISVNEFNELPSAEQGKYTAIKGNTVGEWLQQNMSNLNYFTSSAGIGLLIAGAAAFIIAKKIRQHQLATARTYDVQEYQNKFEEKKIKDELNAKKNITTIENESARAAVDIEYLNTLKIALGGAKVSDILKVGPNGKYTAAQYNAAMILDAVQKNHEKKYGPVSSATNSRSSNKSTSTKTTTAQSTGTHSAEQSAAEQTDKKPNSPKNTAVNTELETEQKNLANLESALSKLKTNPLYKDSSNLETYKKYVNDGINLDERFKKLGKLTTELSDNIEGLKERYNKPGVKETKESAHEKLIGNEIARKKEYTDERLLINGLKDAMKNNKCNTIEDYVKLIEQAQSEVSAKQSEVEAKKQKVTELLEQIKTEQSQREA